MDGAKYRAITFNQILVSIVCAVCQLRFSTASNIGVIPSTLRYLQSPLVAPSSLPNPARNPGALPSGVSPSYYGYDILLDKNRGVTVGAPKFVDPKNLSLQNDFQLTENAQGDLINCRLNSFFTTTANRPSCASKAPPGGKPGDSIGLSLGISPTGATQACSPTRLQNCSVVNYSPGFCYNSTNYGNTWTAGPKTKKNECPKTNYDIMFVLDGSFSIGYFNFETVKDWTIAVASFFNMASGQARIGVVQYSYFNKTHPRLNQMRTEVKLGACRNQACFNKTVKGINWFRSQTFTAEALNKTVNDDFFGSNRINDSNTAKIMVLLTDGKSTDGKYLVDSANYVRNSGITPFAIGVGSGAVQSELGIIATGDPKSTNRVFKVGDFSSLTKIITQLQAAIYVVALEGAGNAATSSYSDQFGEMGFSIKYGQQCNVNSLSFVATKT